MRGHTLDFKGCPICDVSHVEKGTRTLEQTMETLRELAEKIQKHDQIEKLAIPTLNEYSLAPSHTHYVRLAEKINQIIDQLEKEDDE